MERSEELFEKIKNQGKSAIEEFIDTRKTEELFLDFKRSSDDGKGKRLSDIDRNNLSKAISGFGNSEGGVIIWGIGCSKDFDGSDVAKAEYPITDVKRFVSWLEGVISGCTVPPHSGVQNHPVEVDCKGSGFAVTHIPKSDHAPHQQTPSRNYFIRAGSSFVPTPHDVLAGMFGKRPQPKIKINPILSIQSFNKREQALSVKVEFDIYNVGGSVTENLFASVKESSLGGTDCKLTLTAEPKTFDVCKSMIYQSAISKRHVRLPPGGWFQVAQMYVMLKPPFTCGLEIEATVGCGNAPPGRFVFKATEDEVRDNYDQVASTINTDGYDSSKENDILRRLLGVPELQ